jgi:NADPH2:quinone reductase
MTRTATTVMRAAWYDRTGPAHDVFVIGEQDAPEPAAGEVLVHVHASGINPADAKRRAGWRAFKPLTSRVVPHSDGAGIIAAVGEGVDPGRVGERVWVWNAQGGATYGTQNGPETGTASEYIAVPAAHAVLLPDAASFELGACLGGPACTAHYTVFGDGDVAGKTLLVQGGAGAVGELAVQFAATAGARVITTVSSPEKGEIARAAGAHHIINRREQDVVEEVRKIAPDGVERIIEVDFGANVVADAAVLALSGTIVSYSSTSQPEPVMPYYPLQFKDARLHLLQGYLIPPAARTRGHEAIIAGLADGTLRPTVAATFPLEEIAAAHDLVESGRAAGNVVVQVAGS